MAELRDAYRFEARFGKVIAACGVAAVPRALCFYMGELGLSYADLGFLCHLFSYRWTSAVPYPRTRSLALQAGVTRAGIQKRIAALVSLGYLRVEPRYAPDTGRQTSNGYDLSPLLARLESCIRRDWHTVWKGKDPLVGEDEPDPFDAPQRVGIISPLRQPASAGGHQQKLAGGRRQKLAGRGEASLAPSANQWQHPGEESPDPDPEPAKIHSRKQPGTKRATARTTTALARSSSTRQQGSEQELIEREQVPASPRTASARSVRDDRAGERAIVTRMDTISAQLGDAPGSRSSNRTRVRRLWQASGLPAAEFLAAMEEALARTEASADRIGRPEGRVGRGVGRAVPYFFGVLQNVVGAAGRPRPPAGWGKVLRRLRAVLRADLVDELAAAPVELTAEGATITLAAGRARDCFTGTYRPLLERALSDALGRPARARFRHEEEVKDRP